MSKMLKRTRRDLELVLLDLKRAKDFIAKADIAVCRVGGVATTTLHMQRQLDGKVFYEVNKSIGSNLCGLDEGIRKLEHLLAPDDAD